jgi:hypothetical protein
MTAGVRCSGRHQSPADHRQRDGDQYRLDGVAITMDGAGIRERH